MEHFRKILAAVDLGPSGDAPTPGSLRALDRAVWLAERVGASLTLFHSAKPDEYWNAERGAFIQADAGGTGVEVLEARRAALEAQGRDVRLAVGQETAWLAIVREVLREDIDIVVAGKRTGAGTYRRKIGTVARKLLRKCPATVWLEDASQNADPQIILAATDLAPVGDRVLSLAASVAHAFGAELHVVHAFSLSMEAQMEGGAAREKYEHDRRVQAIERIEQILASTPMAGAAQLHVGLASPTQAILDGVAHLKPELVVMGTVSRGGIAGVLMGNTAERLIDRIDCALLTVKPDDFVCPVSLEEG